MEEVKKKRGRPLKFGARKKRMVSSCNDNEYDTIKRAARLSNMTLSEFIRNAAYNASTDVIERRKAVLSDIYGSGEDDYEYDEYYEDESVDEEYM